jgi:hypothetical protein
MKSILTSLCVILPITLFSQGLHPDKIKNSYRNWTPGKIIMKNGDSATCDIRMSLFTYDQLVEVRIGETRTKFSAADVREFDIYDSLGKQTRTYRSVPMVKKVLVENRYDDYVFMEYVFRTGPFGILYFPALKTREKGGQIPPTSPGAPSAYIPETVAMTKAVDSFFFVRCT